jgi:hypothetical protein
MDLSTLAEARMRAWLARPASERAAAPSPEDPAAPLEVQLVHDAAVLDELARRSTDEAERRRLTTAADRLFVRAIMILEDAGRPLAARYFESQRRRAPLAATSKSTATSTA